MKDSAVKSKWFCTLMVICIVLTGLPLATQPAWGQEQPSAVFSPPALETPVLSAETPTTNNQVLFSIPVGDAGILYEGVGTQASLSDPAEAEAKALRWGPSALALGADGTFWVADDVGQRIRHYDATGVLLATIDTSERLINLNDIAVTEHSLFAIDLAEERSIFWELDLQGNTVLTASLPMTSENGITGITLDMAGAVWLEQLDGMYRTQFAGASATQLLGEEKQVIDWSSTDPQLVTLTLGAVKIEIHSIQPIVKVRLLDVTSTGDIFLMIEEMVSTPKIVVDQTVRHYKPDGTLLETARVPIAEQAVDVAANLAVAATNEVYALVPRLNQVEVQRLIFSPDLTPILPGEDVQFDSQVFLPLVTANRTGQMSVTVSTVDALEVRSNCGIVTCTTYFSRRLSRSIYQRWQTIGIGEAIPLLCGLTVHPVAIVVCGVSVWARVKNFETALADAYRDKACLAAKFQKQTGTFLWFQSHNGQHCFGDLSYLLPVKPPSSCPYPWWRTLRIGTRGADVKELQQRLNAAGAKPQLATDADFGPLTQQAVRNFQKSHQLEPDAIVGRLTKAVLNTICR